MPHKRIALTVLASVCKDSDLENLLELKNRLKGIKPVD